VADRVYGKFQWAGVEVPTAGKSEVNNAGTNAYAVLMSAGPPDASAFPSTGVTASVNSSATPVTILAANDDRRGAVITNDSTAILYLLFGAGTVSSTLYTVQLAGNASGAVSYAVPFGFTGIITGLWASVNGAARVTELTA